MAHQPMFAGASRLGGEQRRIDDGLWLDIGGRQPVWWNVPSLRMSGQVQDTQGLKGHKNRAAMAQIIKPNAGPRTSTSSIEGMHVPPQQGVLLLQFSRLQLLMLGSREQSPDENGRQEGRDEEATQELARSRPRQSHIWRDWCWEGREEREAREQEDEKLVAGCSKRRF